jgi:hypothetical protein
LTESKPNNNEFEAAEIALRKIGSKLWFGGLTDEWQDFLKSNTVEIFDTYELTLEQAASKMIEMFQRLLAADPSLLEKDPWATTL